MLQIAKFLFLQLNNFVQLIDVKIYKLLWLLALLEYKIQLILNLIIMV